MFLKSIYIYFGFIKPIGVEKPKKEGGNQNISKKQKSNDFQEFLYQRKEHLLDNSWKKNALYISFSGRCEIYGHFKIIKRSYTMALLMNLGIVEL